MKYIKLHTEWEKVFESNEKLYVSINRNAYNELKEMCIPVKRTYERLVNIFPSYEIIIKNDRDFLLIKRESPISSRKIFIYALEDEWYSLAVGFDLEHQTFEEYYKCDQWDGLLDCLKKECNIS